jgi:hypothetical protein
MLVVLNEKCLNNNYTELLSNETLDKYHKNETFSPHQSDNVSVLYDFYSEELCNQEYSMVEFDKHIMAASQDNVDVTSKSQFGTSILEQYMQARDSDTQIFKNAMSDFRLNCVNYLKST